MWPLIYLVTLALFIPTNGRVISVSITSSGGNSYSKSCSTVNGKTSCTEVKGNGNVAVDTSQAAYGGGQTHQSTLAGTGDTGLGTFISPGQEVGGKTCSQDKVPCDNSECVPRENWCNGKTDCIDSSDERYCTKQLWFQVNKNVNDCNEKHFECDNGPCIPVAAKCDGYKDCDDNSDETDCGNTCSENEVSCDNFECAPRVKWCDGEIDCGDGSDEKYCRRKNWFDYSTVNNCNDKHFECDNGPCVPVATKCDGFKDCDDNSDEINCEEILLDNSTSTDFNYDLSTSTAALETVSKVHADYDNKTTDSVHRAQQWILDQRNECYNWGEDTSRALTALALSSDNLLFDHPEIDLMKNSLMSQLSMKYFRIWYKPPISNKGVLAIYINALVATCQDPEQFWGHNLTDLLSYEYHDDKPVYPLAFLTMCITNTVNQAHLMTLKNFLSKLTSTFPVNLDLQIQGYLALLCFREREVWNKNLDKDVDRFFRTLDKEMKRDGSFGNIYTTALAVQAYIHKPAHHSIDLQRTMDFLLQQQAEDGSFGSMLATYYVLPILKGRSLLHLRNISCGSIPKPNILPQKGTVSFSLLINGDEPVKTKTIFINYEGNMTFFDVMRLAESMDSTYRFEYEEKILGKMVYSISGIPNDIETGMSWSLHSQNKEMILLKDKLPVTLLDMGVDRIFPKNGFAYTFLYDYN